MHLILASSFTIILKQQLSHHSLCLFRQNLLGHLEHQVSAFFQLGPIELPILTNISLKHKHDKLFPKDFLSIFFLKTSFISTLPYSPAYCRNTPGVIFHTTWEPNLTPLPALLQIFRDICSKNFCNISTLPCHLIRPVSMVVTKEFQSPLML